jgi:hypothetical protein
MTLIYRAFGKRRCDVFENLEFQIIDGNLIREWFPRISRESIELTALNYAQVYSTSTSIKF